MTQTRKKPEVRVAEILAAALTLASRTHYTSVTREQIAKAAGVSPAAVQYHFKTMAQLRGKLMRAAVKGEHLAVIAQGLLAGDSHARKASPELRARAADTISA
jgi:AcrR family transcriptional regulator